MKNRLRFIRQEKGISQEQLADWAKTSVQTISRIERGDRRLSDVWIERFCKALNVRPWELFESPEDVYPEEHRAIVSAYYALDDEDQRIVDKFLFGEKKPDISLKEGRPGQYTLHEKDPLDFEHGSPKGK